MKKLQRKQKGATLVTWLIGISAAILIISAGLKVGPSYIEYNSVRTLMNNIHLKNSDELMIFLSADRNSYLKWMPELRKKSNNLN